MQALQLRHDPYDIFRSSRTPQGLYARQKWLQEASTANWRTDFETTVDELYRERSRDGLWKGSMIVTIHRLFGLHLTVRNPDPVIEKALNRLLDSAYRPESAMATDRAFAGKIGEAVVAVRRAGATHVFDTINHMFLMSQMIIPVSTYWNLGIGLEKGEVKTDEEGLNNMRNLGETIAWLGKAIGPHMDSFPKSNEFFG